MTADEIKALAEAFMAAQDCRGWHYEMGNPERDKERPQEWNVVIRWSSPDGNPLDGPGIVIVDESTREARFFMTL